MHSKEGRICLTTTGTNNSVLYLLRAEMEKYRTAIYMTLLVLS